MKSSAMTLILLLFFALSSLPCQHEWEKVKTPGYRICGTDSYGLPLMRPDTIESFKTYWKFRADSTLAFIRCSKCGKYEPVYGKRTAGALWRDSLNAVVDSLLRKKEK